MAVDRRAARLSLLGLVGVLLFSLLGVRLWFLQTVKTDELQEQVTFSKTRTVRIAPERGRIFDVEGRILADNERILTVAVDWQMLRRRTQRTEIFTRLSGWVDVPVEAMEERFDRQIDSPFLPFPIKRDVDEQTAAAILERIEDFPGVEILTEWKRVYPYAPHASHVIGYMGAITREQVDDPFYENYLLNERIGQFGVEASMESVLHGEWGEIVLEVDSANRPVRIISERPPVNGFDVQLTIDLEVQRYAEEALEETLKRRRTQLAPNPIVRKPDGTRERMDPELPEQVPYKAPAGSVVVMNYDTGAVAAMASYPSFDNRWFEAGISGDKFQQLFPQTEDPDQSILVNRAIQGRYNLGSTFKLFTAYAGLTSGLLQADEIYEDQGTYTLSEGAVSDPTACESGLVKCVFKNAICSFNGLPCVYGEVTVEDALAVSSDTFFYRIGDLIMVENDFEPILQERVRLMGFGADTGIELPFEHDGVVPDAEIKAAYAERGVISEDEGRGYFVADNVQVAIGQGLLSSTPLHLATGYGTVANGGFVMQPSIIERIWEPGVPDGEPGFVDVGRGDVHEDRTRPVMIRQVPLRESVRTPLVAGLRRVVTGPGINQRSTTGEELFELYPFDGIPVAGKTGTAQGFGNFPWNDSSVFAAFSVAGTGEGANDLGTDDGNVPVESLAPNPTDPWVVTAYLEKAGYGSQAAAPVVKCVFMMLSGAIETEPLVPSDPLDVDSRFAAEPQGLDSTLCYIGRDGDAVQSQREGAIE